MAIKWTEAKIRAEAAKYDSKSSFRRGCKTAYHCALQQGIIDDLGFKNKQRTWTDEALLTEAAKHPDRKSFMKADSGAHSQATRRGLLKSFRFPEARRKLDDYELIAIGRQHPTRSQFQRADGGAYSTALKRGLMEQMGFGFREGYGEYDAMYVVLAKGVFFNGEQVYKIGLTSARLGKDRFRQLKNHAKMEFEIITLVRLQEGAPAYQIEKRLHAIGCDPKLIKFSGSAEFRALTAEQLAVVLDQISLYSDGNIQA